ncbi:MAG: nucleotidyltransferase family protein [Rhizobiaceae bacterium]
MVLAAGLGKRMRPLTERVPKPLIKVAGKTLLDRGLDLLVEAGVGKAVVNVHHLPEQIIAHVRDRDCPAIEISDERNQLLDSAGGVIKALPMLGSGPFLVLNADTFWVDDGQPNLERLRLAWNDSTMDMLLLLARLDQATGHHGGGDFVIDESGRLRRARGKPGALIYAGAAIVNPGIFAGARPDPHSLNVYFDEAIDAGRLFGLPMSGHWITVGTPDMIAPAENAVLQMLEG